jgi:hypothetical protein
MYIPIWEYVKRTFTKMKDLFVNKKKAANFAALLFSYEAVYAGAGRSPPLAIPGRPGSGLSTC